MISVMMPDGDELKESYKTSASTINCKKCTAKERNEVL